jgi:hypothetical protein
LRRRWPTLSGRFSTARQRGHCVVRDIAQGHFERRGAGHLVGREPTGLSGTNENCNGPAGTSDSQNLTKNVFLHSCFIRPCNDRATVRRVWPPVPPARVRPS